MIKNQSNLHLIQRHPGKVFHNFAVSDQLLCKHSGNSLAGRVEARISNTISYVTRRTQKRASVHLAQPSTYARCGLIPCFWRLPWPYYTSWRSARCVVTFPSKGHSDNASLSPGRRLSNPPSPPHCPSFRLTSAQQTVSIPVRPGPRCLIFL